MGDGPRPGVEVNTRSLGGPKTSTPTSRCQRTGSRVDFPPPRQPCRLGGRKTAADDQPGCRRRHHLREHVGGRCFRAARLVTTSTTCFYAGANAIDGNLARASAPCNARASDISVENTTSRCALTDTARVLPQQANEGGLNPPPAGHARSTSRQQCREMVHAWCPIEARWPKMGEVRILGGPRPRPVDVYYSTSHDDPRKVRCAA